MAVSNLLENSSFIYIDNSSNYVSNITPTGLKDDYPNSANHLNFSMRRFDYNDSSKPCLFAQYYNTNFSQWTNANYQTLGGQTFIDNLASWSGITLPSGSNGQYLCVPYATSNGFSLDLSQAYWTSMGSNTPTYYYVKPYASIIVSADDPIPDSGSTDMSGVVNAILMIPAVLIVLGVFTMIYRMFINRRVRG